LTPIPKHGTLRPNGVGFDFSVFETYRSRRVIAMRGDPVLGFSVSVHRTVKSLKDDLSVRAIEVLSKHGGRFVYLPPEGYHLLLLNNRNG
jgi:hypothetical protein